MARGQGKRGRQPPGVSTNQFSDQSHSRLQEIPVEVKLSGITDNLPSIPGEDAVVWEQDQS